MNAIVDFPTLSTLNAYTQLELEFDAELRTMFSWMKPQPRACFNETLLDEIARCERLIELHQGFINEAGKPVRLDYVVYGSRVPGVFNLGGDLEMFIQAIMRKDHATIHKYARLCIDDIYRRHSGFGADVGTIALVQGKALGGGFECALACDVIIAERSATFSFPEILFSLYPGMGALSFLGRRIGLKKAEELCTSADVYTAKEMYDLGVVDELVEDGLGVESTRRFVLQRQKRAHVHRSIKAAKAHIQPVTKDELYRIVDVWSNAALQLETRDLRMMARLVRAQDRLSSMTVEDEKLEQLYSPVAGAAVNA